MSEVPAAAASAAVRDPTAAGDSPAEEDEAASTEGLVGDSPGEVPPSVTGSPLPVLADDGSDPTAGLEGEDAGSVAAGAGSGAERDAERLGLCFATASCTRR